LWLGGLLKYAAENYGISGVGLTISKEQAQLAEEQCAGCLPLSWESAYWSGGQPREHREQHLTTGDMRISWIFREAEEI